MTNSWKRLASSAIFLTGAIVGAFLVPRPAAAAGCPTTPVPEAGGLHWCYEHNSDKGHVHLWTPAGYDSSNAVTVIYIHGYNNDEVSNKVRKETGSYIDRAWDAHHLATQFAASGINALFIAPEGPIGNAKTTSTAAGIKNPARYSSVLWGSLGSLMTSIAQKGNIAPPVNVTLAAHSAGMYTAQAMWPDARVKHLISLDWVDGPLEKYVSSWYKSGGGRKLTLVGGSGQQAIMDRMQAAIPCQRASSVSSLTNDEIAAGCLYMRTSAGHMGVVTSGKYIPVALKRSTNSVADPSSGTSGGPTGGSGGGTSGITSRALGDATLDAPKLEIPIPGLELSSAVRENGQVTIPWLAQYVGGAYTFLLSIAGLVAAVMMVVGGFQYVTSAGDKTRLSAGKKRIMNALTGLVLALSSYVILYSINPKLVEFEGLKVAGVTTEQYHIEEDGEPSSDLPQEGEAAKVVNVGELGFADRAVALCDKSTCNQFCKNLGTIDTWPTTTKGFMPKEKTVVIGDYRLSDAFPGTKSDRILVSGNNNRAHPSVRDALYAAAKQAVTDYPDHQYSIHVSECWRSIQSQIRKACVGKPGGFTGISSNAPGGVAYPGGSNHGVGYACDLKLYDGSRNMLPLNGNKGDGATKAQCYTVKREDSKRFDDIMFRVGWVRYEAEVWHYEFGSPASNRCGPNAKGGPRECFFPPKKFCS